MTPALDDHLIADCIYDSATRVAVPHIHPGMQVTYNVRVLRVPTTSVATASTRGSHKTEAIRGLVKHIIFDPGHTSTWLAEITDAPGLIPIGNCHGYMHPDLPNPAIYAGQHFQILVPRKRTPTQWLTAFLKRRLGRDYELMGINARVLTTSSFGADATVYLTGLDGRGLYAIPAMNLLSYDQTAIPRTAISLNQPVPRSVATASGTPSAAGVLAAVPYSSPQDIATALSEIVRGQGHVVETLAVAGYDHLVRSAQVKKGNALIVGPTGTGKTESARSLAMLLGMPFVEAKLGGKSTTGFKGDNLNTIFCDLYPNRDHPQIRKAVPFLDELDKVVERVSESASFGPGLQNELIGWIESAVVKVPIGQQEFAVDTTDMMFVAAGAFIGLEDLIAKRLDVDLARYSNGERQNLAADLYEQMMPDDLIAFGLKPELVGRFPYLTFTKPLSRDMLVEILKTGKKSVFNQQVRLMQEGYGITVEIDEEVYGVIADHAQKLGTGARALEGASMELFKKLKFQAKRGSSLRITPDQAEKILAKISTNAKL